MSEITLSATDENLDAVIDFLSGELEALDCPMRTITQVAVAAEEIYVNVAHYAYAPNVGDVTVRFDGQPGEARITFVDSGVPYDPLAKPDPDVTLTAEERGIGGLGIFMVKKSMDEVFYSGADGKNAFTMVKRF